MSHLLNSYLNSDGFGSLGRYLDQIGLELASNTHCLSLPISGLASKFYNYYKKLLLPSSNQVEIFAVVSGLTCFSLASGHPFNPSFKKGLGQLGWLQQRLYISYSF